MKYSYHSEHIFLVRVRGIRQKLYSYNSAYYFLAGSNFAFFKILHERVSPQHSSFFPSEIQEPTAGQDEARVAVLL